MPNIQYLNICNNNNAIYTNCLLTYSYLNQKLLTCVQLSIGFKKIPTSRNKTMFSPPCTEISSFKRGIRQSVLFCT